MNSGILSYVKNEIKRAFKAIFLIVVIFSAFFFKAEYEAYRAFPPKPIGAWVAPFQREGVAIEVKAYSPNESREFLSKNLLSEGFAPVQVTVQNHSKKTYYLFRESVEVEHLEASSVTSHYTRSAIPRSIAFKVAAFFFWPFVIPSVLDSAYSFHSHYKMKSDFHAKSLKEEGEVILPYSSVHRVLFFSSNKVPDEFTLYLQEAQSGRYTPFHLTINS